MLPVIHGSSAELRPCPAGAAARRCRSRRDIPARRRWPAARRASAHHPRCRCPAQSPAAAASAAANPRRRAAARWRRALSGPNRHSTGVRRRQAERIGAAIHAGRAPPSRRPDGRPAGPRRRAAVRRRQVRRHDHQGAGAVGREAWRRRPAGWPRGPAPGRPGGFGSRIRLASCRDASIRRQERDARDAGRGAQRAEHVPRHVSREFRALGLASAPARAGSSPWPRGLTGTSAQTGFMVWYSVPAEAGGEVDGETCQRDPVIEGSHDRGRRRGLESRASSIAAISLRVRSHRV